jgi:cysteinyl-tRNA synthetase
LREVRLQDTLTGEVRTLEAGPAGEVGIYACGPTTYGPIHIGNARPYVVFSVLRRFLEHEGYRPSLVINLTDVNDKIYDAARERGVPSAEHAEEMIADYTADTDRLGLGRPDHEPKATETIKPIVELIEALIISGHAYESGGDVYFRVRSYAPYGELSNRDPDQMDQGEEAGADDLKEDRLDFALWKRRKDDEDTGWPSPWGEGRPGWHIECSAMAEDLLGLEFAVHGGGSDLVFPHHENEAAQTAAARGKGLARIWMHNGMVETAAEQKMAKSVGNIFLLGEALDAYGPETVVAFLLSGHYRQPLRFGTEPLEQARASNAGLREAYRTGTAPPAGPGEPDPQVGEQRERFLAALADDFNTPRAMAALHELAGMITRNAGAPPAGAHETMAELLDLIGLGSLAAPDEVPDAEASLLLAERDAARAARDFDRADEIRDQLLEAGWVVRDTPEGARLVPADLSGDA